MNDLKHKFLLDKTVTFLNHGSYGACPVPIFEDYQTWQRKLEQQPVKFLKTDIWNALRNSRLSLSEFVGCNEDEIFFFHNPTSAIANVINSLQLNEGDEVSFDVVADVRQGKMKAHVLVHRRFRGVCWLLPCRRLR